MSGVRGVCRVKAFSFCRSYVSVFTRLRSFLNITTKLPKYCQRNHPKLQTLQIRVAVYANGIIFRHRQGQVVREEQAHEAVRRVYAYAQRLCGAWYG